MTSGKGLLRALICAMVLGTVPALAGPPPEQAAIRDATRAALPELLDFLRLPNIALGPGPDMRRNADWAAAAFTRRGFQARVLDNGDFPMLFAQGPAPAAPAATVLFYAHMDGQAVAPAEWAQPDPFTPVLKRRAADGSWETLSPTQLAQAVEQPEWRLFARSASDDKAPILMLLAALDALKAQGRAPAIQIKVILDSQEEVGSPTLKAVIDRNRDLLRADAVVVLDGPMHPSNRPTLVFGHRGIGTFNLTVFGPKGDLHSGHFGNYIPNPAQSLAALIASFKDGDGRVVIPGFYDGVDRSPAARHLLAAVPDDAADIRTRAGVGGTDKVGDNYQEAINHPSLNITALKAGDIDSRRSILPARAAASFDIRTVPATPFKRQMDLVRRWVEGQGYHLVDGEPTAAERATYPRLAAIEVGADVAALSTPLDSPLGLWAAQALRHGLGQEPVRIPIMGGTVPTAPLVEGLGVPVLLLPLVNADNNQHAANENLRLGNFSDGVRSLHALLTRPLARL